MCHFDSVVSLGVESDSQAFVKIVLYCNKVKLCEFPSYFIRHLLKEFELGNLTRELAVLLWVSFEQEFRRN